MTKIAILKEKDRTVAIYYNTPIVEFNNHKITLNTGGYYTQSTARRMNQISKDYDLGFFVCQKKGILYVEYKEKKYTFDKNNMCVLKRI